MHVHLIEHEADVDSLDFRPEQKLVLLTQTTLSIDETAGTIRALKCLFPWMKDNKKAAEIVRVEDGAIDKTFSIFGNDNDKSKPINEIYSGAAANRPTDAAGADSHSDKKVEDASFKKSEPPAAFEESRNKCRCFDKR
mgnify:CR=1 FL=1